jgi:hypothetical protein
LRLQVFEPTVAGSRAWSRSVTSMIQSPPNHSFDSTRGRSASSPAPARLSMTVAVSGDTRPAPRTQWPSVAQTGEPLDGARRRRQGGRRLSGRADRRSATRPSERGTTPAHRAAGAHRLAVDHRGPWPADRGRPDALGWRERERSQQDLQSP